MQEWEYKWIQVEWVPTRKSKEKGATFVHGRWEGRDEVEKAGQEGWELVSVQPFTSTFSGESWAGGPGASEVSSYMFFFKRVKGSIEADTSP
jgi:hypothetical protein